VNITRGTRRAAVIASIALSALVVSPALASATQPAQPQIQIGGGGWQYEAEGSNPSGDASGFIGASVSSNPRGNVSFQVTLVWRYPCILADNVSVQIQEWSGAGTGGYVISTQHANWNNQVSFAGTWTSPKATYQVVANREYTLSIAVGPGVNGTGGEVGIGNRGNPCVISPAVIKLFT
jgi:hypothetical protein